MEARTVTIGIAEMGVVQSDHHARSILKTTLGSCVGVILSDPVKDIHGLAHVMLPERIGADPATGKYADTAVLELLAEMERAGSSRKDMEAHVVGGARMFQTSETSNLARIGEKNVEVSLAMLTKIGIPVVFQDTGGIYGRIVTFDGTERRPQIRTLGGGRES